MVNRNDVPDPKLDEIPEHLRSWPGLFVRKGAQIRDASPEDQGVAQRYPRWPDKGALQNGRRITVLTSRTTYRVNDEVHLIHVYEITIDGQLVYPIGPKPVYGEHLDDVLVTSEVPAGQDQFVPAIFDGRALPTPAVDYNFDITEYTFSKPGRHRFDWRVEALRSNTIEIEIVSNGMDLRARKH